MAQPESGGPPQVPPAEEMHWALHLSEDVRDLRMEVRDLREQNRQDLRELRAEVRGDSEGMRTELREEIQALRTELREHRTQVDERFIQIDVRFAQVDRRLDEMRRTMDTRFYWTIGIMVTLFGAQTALIAALAQL